MRSGNPPQWEVGWKASLIPRLLIDPHAGFLDHPHRRHIRPIRLPGQRDHFELNSEMLAEVVRRANRCIRQIAQRLHAGFKFLHAEFDLAHGIQVVGHPDSIRGVERAVQAGRGLSHVVQQAVRRFQDVGAFSLGVALTEHRVENLARIGFQRQRLRRPFDRRCCRPVHRKVPAMAVSCSCPGAGQRSDRSSRHGHWRHCDCAGGQRTTRFLRCSRAGCRLLRLCCAAR